MIESIKSLLAGVKLSITQWLALSAAVVIGGLIAALKLQGSALHKAHIELLGQRFDAKNVKNKEDSNKAWGKYKKALEDYYKAGGVLLLALCLALPSPARSDQDNTLLPRCHSALSACNDLVTTQQSQIVECDGQVKAWKAEAEKGDNYSTGSIFNLVPWYYWAVLGGIGGFALSRGLK